MNANPSDGLYGPNLDRYLSARRAECEEREAERRIAERDNALRHVRLETGHTLRTWDTCRTTGRGMMARTRIGYELCAPSGSVLFRGDDFGPSPMHADDSDEALRALLGFLTLRPGDTDRDYFDGYSDRQRAFAASSECELLQFLYSDDGDGTFDDVEGGEA